MELVGHAWCNNFSELLDMISVYEGQCVSSIEAGLGSCDILDKIGPAELDQLIRKLKASGIRVNSVHAPFGGEIDFSSFDDRVHERGVAVLIEAIEFAQVLEAGYVIVHPGDNADSGDRSRRLDRSIGVIRELAVIAQESGIILAVENLPPGFLCSRSDDIIRIVEAAGSDNVGVCFDTGHANLSPSFKEQAQRLLPYTVTTHIHDNDGLTDLHKFPGFGTIDWRTFAELKARYCPNAVLMLETMPPDNWSWPYAIDKLNQLLSLN